MAIDRWEEAQRPDYAKVLAEREEAAERTRLRRQQEKEALEWQRKTKAEQERAELWGWFESEGGADALVADAQEAAERVKELRKSEALRQEIHNQALITEIDQAAGETQMPRAR